MVLLPLRESRLVCTNSLYLGHTGRASGDEDGIIFAALLRAGVMFKMTSTRDSIEPADAAHIIIWPTAESPLIQQRDGLSLSVPRLASTTPTPSAGRLFLISSRQWATTDKTSSWAHGPPVKNPLPFVRTSKSLGRLEAREESGGN